MTRSPLTDAFAHHVWATLQLIDACLTLEPDQLAADVPGIYGSIIDTIRHLVGADRAYLVALTGGDVPMLDADPLDLPELRATMVDNGPAWESVIDEELDPAAVVIRYRDDGSESHAPRGIRLAQALHHGTDHRSQVCTVLTTLGIEPPAIDVWDFAEQDDRLAEIPPPS